MELIFCVCHIDIIACYLPVTEVYSLIIMCSALPSSSYSTLKITKVMLLIIVFRLG